MPVLRLGLTFHDIAKVREKYLPVAILVILLAICKNGERSVAGIRVQSKMDKYKYNERLEMALKDLRFKISLEVSCRLICRRML